MTTNLGRRAGARIRQAVHLSVDRKRYTPDGRPLTDLCHAERSEAAMSRPLATLGVTSLFPQRPKPGTHVPHEERRLLPGCEMPAFVVGVEEDEIGIRLFRPAPGSGIELVGEDADDNREGHAFDVEIPLAPVLPVEPATGNRRIGEPRERNVVEDVVAGHALRYSVEDPRDERIAPRVVIEEIRRQPDR